MEYSWLIWAIISSVSIGCYGFVQKIQSEERWMSDPAFIFYGYLGITLISLVGLIFHGVIPHFSEPELLFGVFLSIIYVFGVMNTRLKSLKYLSSSTYFINYRVISSIWMLLVGVMIFSEHISLKEILGICVGFIVFYLLIEKKKAGESQKDLWKGFVYLFIGTIFITLLQSTAKYVSTSGYNIILFLFYQGISGSIFALMLGKSFALKRILTISNIKGIYLVTVAGTLLCISAFAGNYALRSGDIAIVYKIISYSLFIPVMFSIIFYKEQVSIRKMIAFALTIFSIYLFI